MTKERYLVEWPTNWPYDENGDFDPDAVEYKCETAPTLNGARRIASLITNSTAEILIYRQERRHVVHDLYEWDSVDGFPVEVL